MKLPHPERAIVEIEKIAGYCLNPEHPEGKHKARVFKSALNLDLDNAEELQAALLQAVATYDAIPGKSSIRSKIYHRFSYEQFRKASNYSKRLDSAK